MKRRRAASSTEGCLPLIIVLISGAILFPVFSKAKHNERRSRCQGNLKRIMLAALQYTQDYNDYLPARQWGKVLAPYVKDDSVFQCPETYAKPQTTDYFGNGRFLNRQFSTIKSPETLVFFGEGVDNSPLDTTLTQLPGAWISNSDSPAWRHLGTANYAFADGHVKAFKPSPYLYYLRRQFP